MAKVKCMVIKRFNNMDPGTEVTAPSRKVAESWVANGLVEIKEKAAPSTKEIKEPEVSK